MTRQLQVLCQENRVEWFRSFIRWKYCSALLWYGIKFKKEFNSRINIKRLINRDDTTMFNWLASAARKKQAQEEGWS